MKEKHQRHNKTTALITSCRVWGPEELAAASPCAAGWPIPASLPPADRRRPTPARRWAGGRCCASARWPRSSSSWGQTAWGDGTNRGQALHHLSLSPTGCHEDLCNALVSPGYFQEQEHVTAEDMGRSRVGGSQERAALPRNLPGQVGCGL